MKRVLTIVITCSLALAANALAQQDEEQQKSKKEKKQEHQQQEKAAQPNTHPQGHGQARGNKMTRSESAPQATTNPAAAQTNAVNQPGGKHNKKERAAARNEAAPNATPAGAAAESSAPMTSKADKRNAKAERLNTQSSPPNASTTQSNALRGAANAQTGTVGKNGKKADVQAIKAEHASFHAQPKPDKVPAVTFNQGYRINGAEGWQGPQYEVFRSYHPEMHERNWYASHNYRVETIGGGAYYWNNGYWFPAWGYDAGAQYYAYDTPIYVGSSARPPDQVIADVQSALQQMGYYQGEVDGLLGPLTRQALVDYQNDHRLYATAVIDEPTLDSLGLS